MSLPAGRLVSCAALLAFLVALPARASAPAGRFVASAGVVHDSKTGLNWQQAVSTATYTYANALTYCSGNAATLPGSGWRLPAIKELQTLVDDSAVSGPTLDAGPFPSTPTDLFWTSTPYAPDAAYAWYVDFSNGNTGYNLLASTSHARCVR